MASLPSSTEDAGGQCASDASHFLPLIGKAAVEAPFIGMHDADFYAAVAKELRVDAPVLHSVIHTHRPPFSFSDFRRQKNMKSSGEKRRAAHEGEMAEASPSTTVRLRNGRVIRTATAGEEGPSTSSTRTLSNDEEEDVEKKSAPSQSPSAPTSFSDVKSQLEEEIALIQDSLHVWKVNRLAAELEKERGEQRCEGMERRMRERLRFKEKAEQDRALTRIENLVAKLQPKLTDSLRASLSSEPLSSSRNKDGVSTPRKREGFGMRRESREESAIPSPTSIPSPGGRRRSISFVYPIPEDPLLRLELKKHDAERDSRTASRVKEIRDFTSSWLVERDLQARYESRACCERAHYLQRAPIKCDEERTRRQWMADFWAGRCLIGFVEDERLFREKLLASEETFWASMVEREATELEILLRTPTPTPAVEEETEPPPEVEVANDTREAHEEPEESEEDYSDYSDEDDDFDSKSYSDREKVGITSIAWPSTPSIQSVVPLPVRKPRTPLGPYGTMAITHEELEQENEQFMDDDEWDEDVDPPTLYYVLTSEMVGE